ncbi:Bifunctional hemolysin/adenylate cyclase [Pseudomonas fluorescens]|uniref:Bifunctional hemolysin/adenylate cyclase n=1 Tax=Pseudomonas fluorescens TaxID=294 RepID=A0A5E7BVK9_PSEFL|nr:calcium-binding protein [Pseudomonas fluorescens]VVN96522.1 Bifunctional hemolysin/adenylate cyclase [Pseudomonas fluorescens]
MSVVNGTSEVDLLSGTEGNDELYGLESDDILLGSAGSDLLDGGEGFDTANYYGMNSGINVEFANGATTVAGPDGKLDTLVGVEKVVGSYFNDTFTSTVGGVTLEGNGGDDVYIVGSEGVTIIEENYGGYDELRTSLNTLKMDPFIEKLTFTGTGDFKAYGSDTDNEIIGGTGNDWLWGGDGADHFVGGDGYDTVSYSDSLEGVRFNDYTNYDGLTIAYGDTFSGIEAVEGSGFDDVFYLNTPADQSMIIDGAGGYDTVSFQYSLDVIDIAVGGNSSLRNVEKVIGSSGADHFAASASGVNLAGGMGDDVYTIDSAGVIIEEIEGYTGGTDHVYTNLSSMHLDPFVENLTYTGTADFTAYGNDESNIILSGAGNDVLSGGAGWDILNGGAGVDIVSYDDSKEGLSASLNWGPRSGIALNHTYIDIEGLRGSQFNDQLIGDSGDNILEGGAGFDQIDGGDGNDIIYGGLASGLDQQGYNSDFLSGGAGDDVIVSDAYDTTSIARGDDGNDTITMVGGQARGGEGNDILTGTGRNFMLFGDEGSDQLILNLIGQQTSGGFADGGEGDDTYLVNTTGLVTIQDSGISLNDTLILNTIANASQLNVTRIGNDAYLHSANDGSSGVPDNGVKLAGWYAGSNTIEHIQTADGQVYDLPASGDAFAMFG